MKLFYCKKCLTTNLRPNASFEDGVCIACRYSGGSGSEKSKKLRQLTCMIRERRKYHIKHPVYDCIVGVSGGKDSTRQAHWVRDRLGMNPLLVCVAYPPKQMSDTGAKNVSNLIELGFDILIATPAPGSSRDLSLESFVKFGNVCKSTELALFSTVPRIAIELGIQDIFWGENPALQVGDSSVAGLNEFDGNNLRNLNTLKEGGNDWIKHALVNPLNGFHYVYPTEIEFNKKYINIYYLGAAWDDWSTLDNSTYAALQGLTLRPGEENSTGDISNASMLDEEFTNINMMIKYYKYGFGRATDQVCEMIRDGKITRDQGIELVQRYDGVCSDVIIKKYCEYINISVEHFWKETHRWVNWDIFEYRGTVRPVPKFQVGADYAG